MASTSSITVEPPVHVYQCRRTEANTLDSTARLQIHLLLSAQQQASLQKMYMDRHGEPGSKAPTVRPNLVAETLRAYIDVDIVYQDFSLVCSYVQDPEAGDVGTDGRMAMIPKPSVEMQTGADQGSVEISVLPRTLPISSTHQGRPFRLVFLLGNSEYLASAPFFVLAKEMSRDSVQGHRPRGSTSKRLRGAVEKDDARFHRLATAVRAVVTSDPTYDFWADYNRRLIAFVQPHTTTGPAPLDEFAPAPTPGLGDGGAAAGVVASVSSGSKRGRPSELRTESSLSKRGRESVQLSNASVDEVAAATALAAAPTLSDSPPARALAVTSPGLPSKAAGAGGVFDSSAFGVGPDAMAAMAAAGAMPVMPWKVMPSGFIPAEYLMAAAAAQMADPAAAARMQAFAAMPMAGGAFMMSPSMAVAAMAAGRGFPMAAAATGATPSAPTPPAAADAPTAPSRPSLMELADAAAATGGTM